MDAIDEVKDTGDEVKDTDGNACGLWVAVAMFGSSIAVSAFAMGFLVGYFVHGG